MTYNFDPDRWYDMEYAALAARSRSGELDATAFDAAVAALDRRLAEMWRRLNCAYQIPAAAQEEGLNSDFREAPGAAAPTPRWPKDRSWPD